MSWQNIDLSKVSTQTESIPAGTYTFELAAGASYDERTGAIKASGIVADENEYKGKRVFFSYPDPESLSSKGKVQAWSAQAFKRLEQAIGVDVESGEDKVAYLHRVAGNRFSMPVVLSTPTDEYPTPRANAQLLNVKAAA